MLKPCGNVPGQGQAHSRCSGNKGSRPGQGGQLTKPGGWGANQARSWANVTTSHSLVSQHLFMSTYYVLGPGPDAGHS